jgi:hypothetical protein
MNSKVKKDGYYTIEPTYLESLVDEGYTCATLIDNKTGKKHDLQSGAYRFFASTSDDADRFVLHLSKDQQCERLATADVMTANLVEIQQVNSQVQVSFDLGAETKADIMITNLLGQPIVPVNAHMVHNQMVSLNVPQDFNGIFIVSVIVNGEQITKKFYTN